MHFHQFRRNVQSGYFLQALSEPALSGNTARTPAHISNGTELSSHRTRDPLFGTTYFSSEASADVVDNPRHTSMSLSQILTIPAEIRSLIFAYAVTTDVVMTYRLDAYSRDSYTEAIQPALTRVSRQIRAESLPLFYECNEFVLHTEMPKAIDSRRWLECNTPHLSRMCRISFWVRYYSAALEHRGSQGALSISMSRHRRAEQWQVDDAWRWITVVRKPSDIDNDAGFLIDHLATLLGRCPNPEMRTHHFQDMLVDLQLGYMNEKK